MRPILRMLPWVLLTTMCAACQVQLDDLQDDAQDALEEVRTRAIELGELSAEELRDLWAMEYKTVEMTTADLDSLDERLNALGKDRWEAYHVSEDGERQVFFFQRRKSKAIAYLTNLLKVGAITF